MMVFRAKSPTRVDLAGGTLDLWPLNCFVENSITINVAIDIFTECELKIRNDKKILIHSKDQNFNYEFSDIKELMNSKEGPLRFFQVHVRQWSPTWGFELTTNSQSPLGGGLGGSSSLSISVMKVFSQALETVYDLNQMVYLAHNLEAAILRTPTGIQDYIPAMQPGINYISFSPMGFRVTQSKVSPDFYNDHALLVYTGRPHQSGLNNFEVMKNAVAGNETTLNALRGIRDAAHELHLCLERNDTKHLKSIFNKEYDCRVQLTPAFTSPEIEKLRKVSLDAGADAIKICGAGGGGCVMVWSSPEKKKHVRTVIEYSDFKVLDTKAVHV